VVDRQRTLARSTFEQATYFSVLAGKMDEFERHINQVKPYYYDYSKMLRPSDNQWPVLGLNLMFLLASNKLSDFHTELELIPYESRNNAFILFPVALEQYLMEGSYNKVLNATKSIPSPYYEFFMNILVNTVREKISTCTEKAYEALPVRDATKLLMFKTDAESQQYAQKRGWKIDDGRIIFPKAEDHSLDIPSLRIAKQTLDYATELEKIV